MEKIMPVTIEESLVMEELSVPGYEKVIRIRDDKSGLKAIICIHNTNLGPALGGTRIYPYGSFDEALNDVLRLAKGMTYKSAVAETGYGGGKSVIISDHRKKKNPEMLRSFGRAVHSLGGAYICAEDVGSTTADMMIIREETPYVVGLEHENSSGDPSYFTAWGTFRGIQAVLKKIYGSDVIEDRTIAIQGVGSVGAKLANLLFWAGAKLILADIDAARVEKVAANYGAKLCRPEEIMSVPCDIFTPCAMGGILNSMTIARLQCRGVAGATNNQLDKDSNADELMRRGILYAPDFVINAGGLHNVATELDEQGYRPEVARQKTHQIYDQLMIVFDIAEQNRFSTQKAAVALGDYRLKYGIGKRILPPCFHHTFVNS